MTQEELFTCCVQYAIETLTYEEYHSMGLDGFHNWVKEYITPIPKSELIVGHVYYGHCRNASKAVWKENGKFEYTRHKFGYAFREEINHYEDDDGYDVFVPVKVV